MSIDMVRMRMKLDKRDAEIADLQSANKLLQSLVDNRDAEIARLQQQLNTATQYAEAYFDESELLKKAEDSVSKSHPVASPASNKKNAVILEGPCEPARNR